MLSFIARRLGVMVLTMLCLTMVVFFLVNLEPNLKKLAISADRHRAHRAEQLESWLASTATANPFCALRQWLGVCPSSPRVDPTTGKPSPRFSFCNEPVEPTALRRAAGRFRLLHQVQDHGRHRSCFRRSRPPAS